VSLAKEAHITYWMQQYLSEKILSLKLKNYNNKNESDRKKISENLIQGNDLSVSEIVKQGRRAWTIGVIGISAYYTSFQKIYDTLAYLGNESVDNFDFNKYKTLLANSTSTEKEYKRIKTNTVGLMRFISDRTGKDLIERKKRGRKADDKKDKNQDIVDFLSKKELLRIDKTMTLKVQKENYSSLDNVLKLLILRIFLYGGIKKREASTIMYSNFREEDEMILTLGVGKEVREIRFKKEIIKPLLTVLVDGGKILENRAILDFRSKSRATSFAERAVNEAIEEAGLFKKGRGMSTLRSSFCILLHKEGMRIEDIQQYMGHTCKESTYTIIRKSRLPQNTSPSDLLIAG